MSVEAKWANGESVLPQARPAQNIEWAWANGESGNIGADEYVAAGGATWLKQGYWWNRNYGSVA